MVANLNDKLIIADLEKYIANGKTVQWAQNSGAATVTAVSFFFIPYYATGYTADVGFVAVEASRFGEFQKLCHLVQEERDDAWDCDCTNKYEFTVNNQFKYGQNNAKTFRFLVFQNPSYKPYQHRFSTTAVSSEAVTALGNLVRFHGDLSSRLPCGQDILGVLKSFVSESRLGGELHSF